MRCLCSKCEPRLVQFYDINSADHLPLVGINPSSTLPQDTQARMRKATPNANSAPPCPTLPASNHMSNELLRNQSRKTATSTHAAPKIHIKWTLETTKLDKVLKPARYNTIELYPKDTFLNGTYYFVYIRCNSLTQKTQRQSKWQLRIRIYFLTLRS